ncbi:uncharacterized protein LOC142357359, partial [Convolutriloba macropyga]|uniref:uncharacterized protein LOC142357359 n=1 Tax=Convolutriloba macropyga TaxID=536237 RepID=UPI003F51E026
MGVPSAAWERCKPISALGGPTPGAGVSVSPTAAASNPVVEAAMVQDQAGNYAVDLPEVLSENGSWDVRRSVRSPRSLVQRFPPPDDHIKTLYDNLELSVNRFHNKPCLGTRSVRSNGKPGRYQWTTFSEVGAARTAAGSALLHYGIEPGSTVGLYSVNCA